MAFCSSLRLSKWRENNTNINRPILVGDFFVSVRTDCLPRFYNEWSGQPDRAQLLTGLRELAAAAVVHVAPSSPPRCSQDSFVNRSSWDNHPSFEDVVNSSISPIKSSFSSPRRPLHLADLSSPVKLAQARQELFACVETLKLMELEPFQTINDLNQEHTSYSDTSADQENIHPIDKESQRRQQATSPAVSYDNSVLIQTPSIQMSLTPPIDHSSPLSYASTSNLSEATISDLQTQIAEFRGEVNQVRQGVQEMQQTMAKEMIESYRAIIRQTTEFYKHQLQEIQQKYTSERAVRRALHNQLQELKGNIRVFCRIRPIQANDRAFGVHSHDVIVHRADDETIHVRPTSMTAVLDKTFQFDHVFGPSDHQENVFDSAKPLIVSLLDGFNVCVMTYGRTAAGKTFTLMGPHHVGDWRGDYSSHVPSLVEPASPLHNKTEFTSPKTPVTSTRDIQRGVIPRSVQLLFSMMRATLDVYSYQISLSILQIYNNNIVDLLQEPEKAKTTKYDLRVHQNGAVEVTNLTEIIVSTVHETLHHIDRGFAQRAVTATELNAHSSRSHCVVTLYVTSEERSTGLTRRSKLSFVDLAGSECVALSQVSGVAAQETSHINRSLSALSDVLMALSEQRPHVPYRNSKLTHLLQDCIGGDAKMLLLLCVSPIGLHVTESLQSLQFGQRASRVQRHPAAIQTQAKQAATAANTSSKKESVRGSNSMNTSPPVLIANNTSALSTPHSAPSSNKTNTTFQSGNNATPSGMPRLRRSLTASTITTNNRTSSK